MNIVYNNIKILTKSIILINNIYSLFNNNDLLILLISRLYNYNIKFSDIIRLNI